MKESKKISDRQQLSTLQNEGQRKPKQRKNEAKPLQYYYQTKSRDQPIASVQSLEKKVNRRTKHVPE